MNRLFPIAGESFEDPPASGIGKSFENGPNRSLHFVTITIWLFIVKFGRRGINGSCSFTVLIHRYLSKFDLGICRPPVARSHLRWRTAALAYRSRRFAGTALSREAAFARKGRRTRCGYEDGGSQTNEGWYADAVKSGYLQMPTAQRCDKRRAKVSHFGIHRAPANPDSLALRGYFSSGPDPNMYQAREPVRGWAGRGCDHRHEHQPPTAPIGHRRREQVSSRQPT